MKIKKLYTFNNNRIIWRLLPAEEKMIIEERTQSREAFFNCINIRTGKEYLSSFQLEEKFWIGIEHAADDFIIFHKFLKPELPRHKGIIFYDLIEKKIKWENNDLSFLFIHQNKIYAFKQMYEEKVFFILNFETGKEEPLDIPVEELSTLREEASGTAFENYLFPESFSFNGEIKTPVEKIIRDVKEKYVASGNVSYIVKENFLFLNFHEVIEDNFLKNRFLVFAIDSEKIILEETLNKTTKIFIPDSFFIKDNLLFVLKEKNQLLVYLII
jgi:hypothetical protein